MSSSAFCVLSTIAGPRGSQTRNEEHCALQPIGAMVSLKYTGREVAGKWPTHKRGAASRWRRSSQQLVAEDQAPPYCRPRSCRLL